MRMPTKEERSLFLRRALLFIFGIAVPVASFVLSSALVETWKGGAKFGFLSLIISSKIVLSPLVLWAVIAFFRTQIYPRREPKRWEIMGLALGTITALFSLLAGFLSFGIEIFWMGLAGPIVVLLTSPHMFVEGARSSLGLLLLSPLMLAPIYTLIWYGWITWGFLSKKENKTIQKIARDSSLISLPFMGAAVVYAQKLYESLPDIAPECYVVSATALAPTRFVTMIPDPSNGRLLSKQLLIIKAFEYAWIASHDSSHVFFRFFYNRTGPMFARIISLHPLLAALAYFSLKPAEYLALDFLIRYEKRCLVSS